jgi:hypothetical protein
MNSVKQWAASMHLRKLRAASRSSGLLNNSDGKTLHFVSHGLKSLPFSWNYESELVKERRLATEVNARRELAATNRRMRAAYWYVSDQVEHGLAILRIFLHFLDVNVSPSQLPSNVEELLRSFSDTVENGAILQLTTSNFVGRPFIVRWSVYARRNTTMRIGLGRRHDLGGKVNSQSRA